MKATSYNILEILMLIGEGWILGHKNRPEQGDPNKIRYNKDVFTNIIFYLTHHQILLNPHSHKLIKVTTLKVISIDLSLMMPCLGMAKNLMENYFPFFFLLWWWWRNVRQHNMWYFCRLLISFFRFCCETNNKYKWE